MKLPEGLRSWIEEEHGAIRATSPVGGGCIHPSARIETTDRSLFAKWGADAGPEVFPVEAAGLGLLRSAGTELRVPAVLGVGDAERGAWLALEWLEPAARPPDFGERLGRGLAVLHLNRGSGWGWDRDGFIGSLPQSNSASEDWADFWWSRRLAPQLRLAASGSRQPGERRDWDRLEALLPELLTIAAEEGPSLLHGDLWGGNVLSTDPGDPALVDPAVYYGHREVDLAMTELFGGFDRTFYAAYDDRFPRAPGYAARRDVYQLYYLLVHVNLFGGGYVGQTAATLRRVVGH